MIVSLIFIIYACTHTSSLKENNDVSVMKEVILKLCTVC